MFFHSRSPCDYTRIDIHLLRPIYQQSKYGTRQLTYNGHVFNRHVCRQNITYWRCSQFAVLRCRARIKTIKSAAADDDFNNDVDMVLLNVEHNHAVITETRRYGSLKEIKQRQMEELMVKDEFYSHEMRTGGPSIK